ncbi:MAG: hypothetical protein BAJALOKI2v1_550009 [Promethearchaeota archaeon]|nr:MAG: hypothetical protein BAJALOKI2v1_550009 [Candidatus Lokiarchaeota archaeon]
MSSPASLKGGPFTPKVLVKKRYLIFYIFIIIFSSFFVQLEFWVYWRFLYGIKPAHFIIFLPLLFFVMYVSLVLVSLLIAKILLMMINAIHKPREGVFYRKKSDKDYRYWSIRNTIKRFPIWVSHKFPFPFMDNICLKIFGVKTKFSNSLFEGWIDTEFIEFGENVVVGQGSIVQSAVIIGEFLIIRKTIIEDNVRIGTHSVVMPGTHIKRNAILAAHSNTIVDQVLEEGWIYIGVPARKFKKNRFFEDGLEPLIKHVDDIGELRNVYESVYEKRYDAEVSNKEE